MTCGRSTSLIQTCYTERRAVERYGGGYEEKAATPDDRLANGVSSTPLECGYRPKQAMPEQQ